MIHDYYYKPNPVFGYRGRENGKRTYGVELECEPSASRRMGSASLSDRLDDVSDRIYCKHDGSLNDGVEIVSHPGTLYHHMYQLRWKALCQTAVKAGYRSHDAAHCGLHIHIGREQLGTNENERDDVARKLTVLVYRNWDQLVNFSRRRESQLDEWAPMPQIGGTVNRMLPYVGNDDAIRELADAYLVAHDYDHADRYTAVNMTNDTTVEIRIFRGTLKRDTIIAALQLVDNLCEYATTHTWTDILTCTWADVALVKRYAELDAYLVARNLAPVELIDELAATAQRRTPDFVGPDGIVPGVTAA
jgi:hypothetical protein